MRGPLSHHNIPLSRTERAIAFPSANRKEIVVKVAIKHFLLPTNLKLSFLNIES
jgi:hypothetical protein